MPAFTVRVPDKTAERLDRLAEKQERSRSYMTEAESGQFVSTDDVARVIAKHVQPAPRS